MRHEEIEPTNNASESALRQSLILQKPSFGAQIASRSRFVEMMLTVIKTCRQQHRNVFVTAAAVEAHLVRQPTPSPLPGGVNGYVVLLGVRNSIPRATKP